MALTLYTQPVQAFSADFALHGSAQSGDLTLTTPLAFGRLQVLPVVSAFLAAFEDIRVRMVLSDTNLHLIDEHIDVAVRIGHRLLRHGNLRVNPLQ